MSEVANVTAEGAHKPKKTVTVYYAGTPLELEKERYTTEQLRAVFQVEQGYVLDLIAGNGDFVELKPGEEVKVREDMRFVSHPPCGQSS
ncbi:MAG TPA: hypothetical protein VF522_04000 [Ramlibacter sp.]|uniref:hypothetical protein n=1 Tax=Ramlibacter sp. TaxID=1917967 RepID=UPI002ED554FA